MKIIYITCIHDDMKRTPLTAFFTVTISVISIETKLSFFFSFSTPVWPLMTLSLSFNQMAVEVNRKMPTRVFQKRMSKPKRYLNADFRSFSRFLATGTSGSSSGLPRRRVQANSKDMSEVPSPKAWCTRTTM